MSAGDLLLQFHVAISLIAIATGLVVVYGLVTGKSYPGWTVLFLSTTILTSLSGFPLPPFGFDPARAIGILLLILMALAVAALYGFHLGGAWRWLYVGSAVIALYLNIFVGVVQAFQKLAFLQQFAPTQSEPPFVIVQVAVLAAFIVIGGVAGWRFHPVLKGTT